MFFLKKILFIFIFVDIFLFCCCCFLCSTQTGFFVLFSPLPCILLLKYTSEDFLYLSFCANELQLSNSQTMPVLQELSPLFGF